MATLTIRNVDNAVREQIRLQAAENGRSMEAELRAILEDIAAKRTTQPGDVFRRVQAEMTKIGGLKDGELHIPERTDRLADTITFDA